MKGPKSYPQYDEAKEQADESGEPLWDTHALPDRYVVGDLPIEMEEDYDNEDWTQLQ